MRKRGCGCGADRGGHGGRRGGKGNRFPKFPEAGKGDGFVHDGAKVEPSSAAGTPDGAAAEGQAATPPPTRTRVEIYGDEYVIRGHASPEHIAHIARLVDQRLRELVRRHKNVPFHRIAVLAALHFADEYVRAKDENAELLELIRDA